MYSPNVARVYPGMFVPRTTIIAATGVQTVKAPEAAANRIVVMRIIVASDTNTSFILSYGAGPTAIIELPIAANIPLDISDWPIEANAPAGETVKLNIQAGTIVGAMIEWHERPPIGE